MILKVRREYASVHRWNHVLIKKNPGMIMVNVNHSMSPVRSGELMIFIRDVFSPSTAGFRLTILVLKRLTRALMVSN